MGERLQTITAGWPAPDWVRAMTTARRGGVSQAPFDALNLALHVGDDPHAVDENRNRLMRLSKLPSAPVWLEQVHGTRVVVAEQTSPGTAADGAVTSLPGVVCAIMTADCLPLFLCDRAGTRVGLLHVGWRGLAEGIVETGVEAMTTSPARLIAWMGPAIGPAAFEVGDEVKRLFEGDGNCFRRSAKPGHWLADLYGLVRQRLARLGVGDCYGAERSCTYSQPELFFSYRRDGACGRMASLIWLATTPSSFGNRV